MKITVITLFPEAFRPLVGLGVTGRAIDDGKVALDLFNLTERKLHRHKQGESRWVLALAILGLALHATLDGAALGAGGHHEHGPVEHAPRELGATLAILVHRLPVGLLVWWTVRPSLGKKVAIGTLGALAAATVLGYMLSAQIAHIESGEAAGLVNALLAGGLLHVILGHGHPGG